MASILVFSERANLAFELLGKAKDLGGQMGLEVVAAAFNPADAETYLKRNASKVFCSGQGIRGSSQTCASTRRTEN